MEAGHRRGLREQDPAPQEDIYTFEFKAPKDKKRGVKVTVEVSYHIMTEMMHGKLARKYGLASRTPYSFVVYNKILPLAR